MLWWNKIFKLKKRHKSKCRKDMVYIDSYKIKKNNPKNKDFVKM